MSSDKKTLVQLTDEIARRKHEDPLAHVYHPHQFQEQIHADRHPITLVLGGNRTGKTWGAVTEALHYCLGRSKWAEVPEPPVTVWYVMPSLTMFRRAIVPVLKQLIPMPMVRRWDKQQNVIYFNNGSELHMLSSDMRQRRLQGASVDFIVMDEAQKQEVFEELQARVFDRKGRILMVLTPVDEIEANWLWIRDTLFIPWEAGERPDIHVIFMPVADEEGNPLVPQYTREDIKRLEEMYPDPQVRSARLYGNFVTRSGLVFASFDENIHLVPRFEIPHNFTRWIVVDPQYHRFAALYFAADERGHYYVTDEYFSQDEPLATRAQRMVAILGPHDGPSIPVYVDSANPQDMAELNWHFQRINAPLGAVPLPMKKEVDKMVLRVHSYLEPSEQRHYHRATGLKDVSGAPRLTFFHDIKSDWRIRDRAMNTSRLIWEMKRLIWDSGSGKPDKKSADGADASDALIYGCSIMATGFEQEINDDWKKGLPVADVLIWEAIEREDLRQKRGDVWNW
jgi:hypothetical protein